MISLLYRVLFEYIPTLNHTTTLFNVKVLFIYEFYELFFFAQFSHCIFSFDHTNTVGVLVHEVS